MSDPNARLKIIQAANRFKLRHAAYGFTPRLLGRRHLQQAVCIVRRNHLVGDDVLVAAGFKPAHRRSEQRRGVMFVRRLRRANRS